MTWTTPDLCDEHVGLQVLDGFTDYGGRERFCGEVVTARCPNDNSMVRELVNRAGDGRVMVIAGGGDTSYALLGDQLAQKAAANGWAGIVVDGAVRDVEILRTLDLGVRGLGTHPMRTQKRGRGATDLVVVVQRRVIRPGNWIYADATGIVVAGRDLTRG